MMVEGDSGNAVLSEVIQKSRVKVTKNSKGYNWELSLIKEDGQTNDEWLTEYIRLEQKLQQEFGVKGDDDK